MGRLVFAVAASTVLCAQAVAAPALAADQPRAVVHGELDPALKAAIVEAIGQTDRPIDNRFEARRRARDAAEAAIAVLRSEGYYEYSVEPDVGEGDTPSAAVTVAPGPRFVIAQPTVAWVGKVPDPAVAAAAAAALRLKPGEPGRALDIVSAEGRAVAVAQARGYADAAAAPREVVVDHADRTVRPTFRIAAGPLVRLDGIQLITEGRTEPRWLQGLASWKTGQTYDPEAVAELERRLLDPGVYESVTVALAPAVKTTPDGLRPVVVSLADRKRRTLELGASYGTSEGFGLDAKWTRYNYLGRADTTSLLGRISNVDSRIEASEVLPHWRRPAQKLTGTAAVYRTSTPAYDETGVGVRADVQRRFGKTSYLTVGASVDLSRTDALQPQSLTPLGRDVATLGTLADLTLDRSDDPLDPRRGWRLGLRAQPTLLLGQGTVPYLRMQTQGTAYLPLDAKGRTVVAGRLRLGDIFNSALADIPASRRFYAGGGGSVRGFPYQEVGPKLPDNTPQGGLSLLESSVELRRRIGDHWGVVGFVDAGDVGTDQFPGLKNLSVGAGIGVRYFLNFGPIRVDLATPVANRQGAPPVQVYVSIGQSF